MEMITKQFLTAMRDKIKEDVQKNMEELVNEKLSINLALLVSQGIVSVKDADEFRKEHGLSVSVTKRKKAPISSDPCGGGFSRSASC